MSLPPSIHPAVELRSGSVSLASALLGVLCSVFWPAAPALPIFCSSSPDDLSFRQTKQIAATVVRRQRAAVDWRARHTMA